jgi:hypothetical protein
MQMVAKHAKNILIIIVEEMHTVNDKTSEFVILCMFHLHK